MIQVLHRAIDILEKVAAAGQPINLGRLADELGLKPGTCANIVKTLVERGFLKKSEQQKGYLLGAQLLKLAGPMRLKSQLQQVSDDILLSIVDSINENCLVAILFQENRLIVNHKTSGHKVQAVTSDQKSAYDSSTGRLLLAFMEQADRRQFVYDYGLPGSETWPQARSEAELYSLLNDIREQGYVIIEDSVQIVGFAAPVFQDGKIIAALSIYVPAFRFDKALREKMLEKGLKSAESMSKRLSL